MPPVRPLALALPPISVRLLQDRYTTLQSCNKKQRSSGQVKGNRAEAKDSVSG